MVETITPVVHGGRRGPYYFAVALHVLGATASAAALGVLLGGVGLVFGAPWGDAGTVAVVVAATLYAARELALLPLPLPDLDRQVPDWWRTFYSPPVAALLYGAGLGVGFFTYLSFGTLVPVAVAAVASGNPAIGAGLLSAFGAARGLSVLIVAGSDEDPERAVEALRTERLRARVRVANGVMLVAIAAMGSLVVL